MRFPLYSDLHSPGRVPFWIRDPITGEGAFTAPPDGMMQILHDTGHDLRIWLSPDGIEIRSHYRIPEALVGSGRAARSNLYPDYTTSTPIIRNETIDRHSLTTGLGLSQHRLLGFEVLLSRLPDGRPECRDATTRAQGRSETIEGQIGPVEISLAGDGKGGCRIVVGLAETPMGQRAFRHIDSLLVKCAATGMISHLRDAPHLTRRRLFLQKRIYDLIGLRFPPRDRSEPA